MQPLIEGQPRLTKPFVRLVDKVTGRGDTSLLTHADRRNLRRYDKQLKQETQIELKTYREFLDQADKEFMVRLANEPKVPTYIEVDGKKFSGIEYFMYLHEQYEQAKAMGREEEYLQSLTYAQSFGTGQPLTLEQQREQTRKTIPDLNHHMAKEARDAQFDRVAEVIQEKIWKNATPVAIDPVGQLIIDIQDDGSIINRSRYGATISYTHKDIDKNKKKVVHLPRKEELSFGIGYFTDRADIAAEARGYVADEDLEKGIKAYFVERSYSVEEHGKVVRKTEMVAIPMGYTKTQQTFIEHLYKNAKSIAPEKVLPQAKERVKASRRNRHYAAAA